MSICIGNRREGEAPAEPRARESLELGHDFESDRLGGSLALPALALDDFLVPMSVKSVT